MTRSIFDPGGGETERSGSTHMGPDAANISHLPPDVTDGEVEDGDDNPTPIGADADEVAQRLREMSGDGRTGDSSGIDATGAVVPGDDVMPAS
jgi:hypothetical protein